MTRVHRKKKRGPNWFSHVNWSSEEVCPQFCILLTLQLHYFKIEDETQGQTRAQRQGNFKDNSILVMLLVSLESPQQGGVHVSHFAILR
jgi:hypothetical protein